jgi:hypothetical protein
MQNAACKVNATAALQTTALINELYLCLADLKLIDWQSRAHFFALCARQMRRILTDQARARRSDKRGGGAQSVSLDVFPVVAPRQARIWLPWMTLCINCRRQNRGRAWQTESRGSPNE